MEIKYESHCVRIDGEWIKLDTILENCAKRFIELQNLSVLNFEYRDYYEVILLPIKLRNSLVERLNVFDDINIHIDDDIAYRVEFLRSNKNGSAISEDLIHAVDNISRLFILSGLHDNDMMVLIKELYKYAYDFDKLKLIY